MKGAVESTGIHVVYNGRIMIYQMNEPFHGGSDGPSLLLLLTSWGSLLKKGTLWGGDVAVAPVDVILPITKG